MNKRLLFLIVLHVFCFNALKSQNVPQAINYQTVVRNTVTGAPIADTPVTLLFQIADNGTIVYSEKQIDTTNSLGLINLVIGQGFVQEGAFQTINWGSGPKMLTISIESAPNNFEFLGTMQLVSVPYALYAAESDKASPTGPAAGDLAGTYPDPVIREGAVTAEKLNSMGAENGQVLQWNGTGWMPVTVVGPQGIQGEQGLQGVAGPQGPQGETGPQGPQGFTGPQGPQGVAGAQGPQGETGLAGPQGVAGAQGIQGAPGPMGLQGFTGPQGPQGVAGAQGQQGETGPMGLQGLTGAQGPIGPMGLQGPQGEQGPPGISTLEGDVTGLAGTTTVEKIKGRPVSSNIPVINQVLKWNGSSWAPALDNGTTYTADFNMSISVGNLISAQHNLAIWNANRIQGQQVAVSSPSNGEVLKWDSFLNAWAPDEDNTGSAGGFSDCGKCDPERIGINTINCPDADARLHILDSEASFDKKGIKLELTDGGFSTGLNLSVENGSNSNDGVLLYSRAGGNSSGNGIRIAADPGNSGSNTNGIIIVAGAQSIDDAVIETNNAIHNYGMYAVAKNNFDNDGSSVGTERDIAVYGRVDNLINDWAGYFDGNVGVTQKLGVRTANPEKEMHLIHGRLPSNNFNTNNQYGLKIENEGPNHRSWTLYTSNDGGNLHFYLDNILKSTLNASTGSLGPTSDERLKQNISTLEPVLAKIDKIAPKRYIYKDDRAGKNVIGLLAQEVEQVFPEFIEKVGEGDEKLYTLDYAGLSVIAIKAIQEQQQIIETQQAKIITQDARLDALEKEMAEMKAMWKANMVAKSGKE